MKSKRTYGVIVSFLLIASFIFSSMGNISIYATTDENSGGNRVVDTFEFLEGDLEEESSHLNSEGEEKGNDILGSEDDTKDTAQNSENESGENIIGGNFEEDPGPADGEGEVLEEDEMPPLLQGVLLDGLEPEIIEVYTEDEFYEALNDIAEGGIIELYNDIEITQYRKKIEKSLTIRSGTGSPVTIKCDTNNPLYDRFTLHIESSGEIILNLQDVIFEGTFNGSTTGSIVGGLYVKDNTKVKIEGNGKFINNGSNLSYREDNGGAVFVGKNSTLEIGGTTYFENNYSLYGGAVYGDERSTVIIRDNVVFYKNLGNNTGAVYMPKDSTSLKISGNVQFLENEGVLSGGGGAIFTHADITEISDYVVFKGNLCDGVGAIYGGGGHIEISGDVQFLNNVGGTFSVGAVYFRGGTALITDDVLFDNNSATHGGAIMALNKADVEIDGAVKFENNKATAGHGGAIYLGGSSFVELNGEVYFENNSAVDGGAVFATESSVITMGGNVSFVKNLGETGGAIRCKSESIINISGFVTFSENQAEKFGGAIATNNAIEKPMIIDGEKVVFYKNTAGESGGAIYLDYSDAEIRGVCQFTENEALSSGGAVFAGYGAWAYLEENVQFINNSANSGGALCGYNGISYFIKDTVTFTENYAEKFGGAIEIDMGSYLELSGKVQFEKNEATDDFGAGGAIYINDYSELDIRDNVMFLGNKAKYSGGAVYSIDRVVSAVGGNVLFEDNKSGMDGGAFIVSHGSNLTVEGSVRFIGNHAENHGGAIDTGYESNVDPDFKPYIFLSDDVQFINNYAKNNGGAIYEYDTASIEIEGNVLFSGNSTDGSRGAVYIRHDSELTVGGEVKFFDNKALNALGGAIYTGDYYCLYVGPEVQFNNNDASYVSLDIPDEDKAIHKQQIFASQFTNDMEYGYNNVDINAVKDRYLIVDFETDGGSPVPKYQVLKAGELVNAVSEPYKQFYKFRGWFTKDGDLWNFSENTVQENMTLYAKWEYNHSDTGEEDRDRDRDRDKGGNGNNSNTSQGNNRGENNSPTENYVTYTEERNVIVGEEPANIIPDISDSRISLDNNDIEIADLSEKISDEPAEIKDDGKTNPITGARYWYLPAVPVILLLITAVCILTFRKRRIYN